MTHEEIRQAVQETQMFLPIPVDGFPERNVTAVDPWEQARHCEWMVGEILSWGPEKDGKAQRWLGFIQGWLWSQNLASVSALRSINRGPAFGAATPTASSASPPPSAPTPA